MNTNKELLMNTDFEKYLCPADPTRRRCVDERHADPQTYGPQIQGATSGEVDALKQVRHLSEKQAWKTIQDAGIPLDGHVDDHKGANGCGYNNRVETDPTSVGAPESVTALSRLQKVMSANGNVLHYHGDHAPVAATINYIPNTTLDTNRISTDGIGTFNLDAWILQEDAQKLKLTTDEAAAFMAHVVDSYKKTVMTLTNQAITTFVELHSPTA